MSPISSAVGAADPSARPTAVDTVPSMPLAPRLATTVTPWRGRRSARRHGSASTTPPPAGRRSAALQPRRGQSRARGTRLLRQRRRHRSGGRVEAARHRSSQCAGAGPATPERSAATTPAGGPSMTVAAVAAGSDHPDAPTTTSPAPDAPSHSLTTRDEPGAPAAGSPRVATRRRGAGAGWRRGARCRWPPGSTPASGARPAPAIRVHPRAPEGRPRRLARPRPRSRPGGRRVAQLVGHLHGRRDGGGRAGWGGRRNPGPVTAPRGQASRGAYEWLPERQVQVDGAGPRPRVAAYARPAKARARRRRRVGHAGVAEPAHGPAEQVHLVDGLGRTHVAQLGGSIRVQASSGTPARSASTTAAWARRPPCRSW